MLTNIYDVLRSPKRAMARIADEADIWKSLNIQAIILFINALTNQYDATEEKPLWIILLAVVFAVPIILVLVFIMAGVTHGIARLVGGQGTWKQLFITFGYTMLPQMLFIPFQVVFLVLGMETAVIITAVIASIWEIVLSVFAISQTEKIGVGKSCFVLFAPSIFVGIIGAIVVIAILGVPQ